MTDKRILIVEDDQEVRASVAGQLAAAGFEVISASTSEEALSQLEDGSFDLLVMDLQMPTITGRELLKHVRTEKSQHLPVIILSTGSYPTALETGIGRSTPYLSKPFPFFAVREAVQQALKQGDFAAARASLIIESEHISPDAFRHLLRTDFKWRGRSLRPSVGIFPKDLQSDDAGLAFRGVGQTVELADFTSAAGEDDMTDETPKMDEKDSVNPLLYKIAEREGVDVSEVTPAFLDAIDEREMQKVRDEAGRTGKRLINSVEMRASLARRHGSGPSQN